MRTEGKLSSFHLMLTKMKVRNFLEVQGLRFQSSNVGSTGSIPGQGTKIPQAARPKKKKTTSMPVVMVGNSVNISKITELCE